MSDEAYIRRSADRIIAVLRGEPVLVPAMVGYDLVEATVRLVEELAALATGSAATKQEPPE